MAGGIYLEEGCVFMPVSVGLVDRGSLCVYTSVKLSVLIRILEPGSFFVPSGAPLSTDTFIWHLTPSITCLLLTPVGIKPLSVLTFTQLTSHCALNCGNNNNKVLSHQCWRYSKVSIDLSREMIIIFSSFKATRHSKCYITEAQEFFPGEWWCCVSVACLH